MDYSAPCITPCITASGVVLGAYRGALVGRPLGYLILSLMALIGDHEKWALGANLV